MDEDLVSNMFYDNSNSFQFSRLIAVVEHSLMKAFSYFRHLRIVLRVNVDALRFYGKRDVADKIKLTTTKATSFD